MLETNLDPPGAWDLHTELPVYTLARAIGMAPHRQWLVYGHSPLGERRAVQISLPGFGPFAVDVSVGGSFYVLDEVTRAVTRLANPSGP
jgi:hypothetical protein